MSFARGYNTALAYAYLTGAYLFDAQEGLVADLSNSFVTGANYNDQTVGLLEMSNFSGFDPVARGMVYVPSVVPVPAAVWLFGSGLGLLGWMQRKPAA